MKFQVEFIEHTSGFVLLPITTLSSLPRELDNRTCSPILSSGTKAKCANYSKKKTDSTRNNEKYILRPSNFATTGKKIKNEL